MFLRMFGAAVYAYRDLLPLRRHFVVAVVYKKQNEFVDAVQPYHQDTYPVCKDRRSNAFPDRRGSLAILVRPKCSWPLAFSPRNLRRSLRKSFFGTVSFY